MCIPYQDNGCMRAYIIDNKGNMIKNMCFNEICGFDNKSKPIMGFYQPMITACFIQNDDLFFSIHHRIENIQKSFIYSWKQDQILSEIGQVKLEESTKTNFPIKSFYSCLDNEIYTFYRQGHALKRSSVVENTNIQQEKISNADLGQMFLVFDKALIVRSSNSMIFFKKSMEEDGLERWI